MTEAPKAALGRGLHLHFDPGSGIAGDMTVAALVDLGVPAAVVVDAVAALGIGGLRLGFERRVRGAFSALGFTVTVAAAGAGDAQTGYEPAPRAGGLVAHAHAHRTYASIRRLLADADLPPGTRERALAIFASIAEVEAALHGVIVDDVAFHELGAWDSIADIVGASAALDHLAPASVSSAPVVVGTGTVKTAHGPVSVPAPATAALLIGIPIRSEGEGELTTPTGAAILARTCSTFGSPPPMVLRAVGYGAGTKTLRDRANVLRVLAGDALGRVPPPPPTTGLVLEANIDDLNPQLVEPLLQALLAAGALDAWVTPVLMKKGRPGLVVAALSPYEAHKAVAKAFFLNSTTLGLRETAVTRTVLARSMVQVDTAFGSVAVKLAALDGSVVGATPEFEDCRRLAEQLGIPVRAVLTAAVAAAAGLVPAARRGS